MRASGACVLAAAIVVPWTFSPSLFDPHFLPKLLVASLLGAAGAVAALREGGPAETPLAKPLVALLLVAAASAAFSPDPSTSFLGTHLGYGWCLLGWLPCLALYRVASAQDRAFADRLAAAFAIASIPVCVLAFAQALGLDPRAGGRLPSGRVYSSLSSPVTLGAYLAAVLPVALHLRLRGGDALQRTGAALAAAASAAALYLTGSRAAWLGALAGAAVYLAAAEGREAFRGRRGWVLAAAGLACAAGLAALAGERTNSDRQRVELWRVAGRLFSERPLLGVGPQAYALASRAAYSEEYAASVAGREAQSDAHNDWLQVLCGLGLLGALAYAWLHLEAWRLWRAASTDATAAAFAGGLAALFVALKLNGASWTGPFFAALLAGGLASCRAGARGRERGLGSWLASVAGIAAFGATLWLVAADRLAQLGVRARREGRPREAAIRLEAAVRLRPSEAAYRQALANLLWDVAGSAAPADRAGLLRRAAEVAGEAVLKRPADSGLYLLAGLAELRRFEWAGEPRLGAASALFRHGLALDPHSAGLLEGAAKAAKLAGRADEAAELETRLFRLTKKR